MRKIIHMVLGIGITFLFIYLSYCNVGKLEWKHLIHYPIRYGFVALSILFFIASQWFRAMAWSKAMDPQISTKTAFQAVCIGNATNMVLPFRMGEAARILTLSNFHKELYGKTGIHLVVERIIDILILGFLALFTTFFVEFKIEVLQKINFLKNVMEIGIVIGIIGLLVLNWMRKMHADRNTGIYRILRFMEQISILKSPKTILKTIFFLFLSWICVYGSALAGNFGVGIGGMKSIQSALLVVVLTNLGMLIPAAPGGIGIFQYASLYAYSILNVPLYQATILSVLLHLVQYSALIPLGAYFFVRGQYSLRHLYTLSNRSN